MLGPPGGIALPSRCRLALGGTVLKPIGSQSPTNVPAIVFGLEWHEWWCPKDHCDATLRHPTTFEQSSAPSVVASKTLPATSDQRRLRIGNGCLIGSST